ncbi:MAG: hypothetical protein ISS69_13530 [Phycisphaerae bacterium]|nr:hypothetical protein [Planctomycetota bacterium]MBL7221133.1 hypothetical protein [Phycisphaerae bacterium]
MIIMRKFTLDDFQNQAPRLADACDAKTLASIIDAYNSIVPEDGKPLEDMSILLEAGYFFDWISLSSI